VNVKATISGLALMAGALMLAPPTLEAQAPVVLVCQDGSTQPGSSKVACADHQGMDWEATKAWSEMRAGRFASRDSVVCIDGQRVAASKRACSGQGGVDSVSTLAAVRRRAQANRQAQVQRATSEAAGDSMGTDSTKWGYPVNRNPDAQNPPGYRGMERPASQDSAR
jgi:hypothetical protein